MGQGARSVAGRVLEPDDALRRQLGLEAGESVRVLDAGVRTILLERTGGPACAALPWDHPLVLTGDVRAFSLADLLGLVHAAQKSGFLFFTHRDHAKSIYLHAGEVVFATSNQRVDRLGECLLRAGVIHLDQLREAERRFQGEGRFGKVLVERGFLTPRELWNGVKYQVEEIVRSLFSYTEGAVHFWEGEVQPDNVVRLSLSTARLVAEGIQRRDELLRFMAVLDDPRVRLLPVPSAAAHLGDAERPVFDALGAGSAFPALVERLGLDALTAARTLQLLRLVGALRLSRQTEDAGFVGEGDLEGFDDDDAVRECVVGTLKLLAELVAPLVAMDGVADVVHRLARVLDETRPRHAELLGGIEIGPGAELDPGPLAEKALRLRGPRVPAVRAALGELVAYLEFEIRNHPRIVDPEELLASVVRLG
jgi:hypothetical protein